MANSEGLTTSVTEVSDETAWGKLKETLISIPHFYMTKTEDGFAISVISQASAWPRRDIADQHEKIEKVRQAFAEYYTSGNDQSYRLVDTLRGGLYLTVSSLEDKERFARFCEEFITKGQTRNI